MKKNVELLKKTLAHIEAHPEEWCQTEWRCSSGLCFAGWAGVLAGGTWMEGRPEDDHLAYILPPGAENPIHVSFFAREALGLTWDEADDLFGASNTLGDLRELVAQYAGEDEAA